MDIKRYEDELAQRKDAFWARKIVFTAGVKAFIQIMHGSDVNYADQISTIIAADIYADMRERYSSKDPMELSLEMMADTDKLLEVMLVEADKELSQMH